MFGIVERNERVRGKVMPNTDAKTLLPEVRATIASGTAVITDGLASYDEQESLIPTRCGTARKASAYWGKTFIRTASRVSGSI